MKAQQLSECKVVIFFEDSHYNPQTAQTLDSLLPFFREHDFKALCFESSHTNKSEELLTLKRNKLSAEILSFRESDNKNEDKYAKFVLTEGVKINLLESLDENDIQYCGMDMPGKPKDTNLFELLLNSAKRTEYMANTIEKLCHTENVLALVGFGHYELRERLIDKGLLNANIKGYYIPITPLPKSTMRIDFYERQLRPEPSNDNIMAISTHDNTLTVDLLKDNNLNASSIILQDYSNYLLGQHSTHVEL